MEYTYKNNNNNAMVQDSSLRGRPSVDQSFSKSRQDWNQQQNEMQPRGYPQGGNYWNAQSGVVQPMPQMATNWNVQSSPRDVTDWQQRNNGSVRQPYYSPPQQEPIWNQQPREMAVMNNQQQQQPQQPYPYAQQNVYQTWDNNRNEPLVGQEMYQAKNQIPQQQFRQFKGQQCGPYYTDRVRCCMPASKAVCPPPEAKKPCPGEYPLDCRKAPLICPAEKPCGPCIKPLEIEWCNRETVCDERGAGIRPLEFEGTDITGRRKACCTPITQYMRVHGELAKKLLTRDICLPTEQNSGPPCNVCEDVMPLCRGYYQPYECVKAEEYNYLTCKDGQPILRSKVDRYWNPCVNKPGDDRNAQLAGHNYGLLQRLRRRHREPCW